MNIANHLLKYKSIGISFSPAGLLTPFHLGASTQLQKLGYLTPMTHLSGASGGALCAMLTALIPFHPEATTDPLATSLYVAQQCRDHGTRGTLRKALEEVLKQELPETCHLDLQKRPGKCTIAFTEIKGTTIKPRLIHDFQSKTDVIECLLASCNIPYYFNGNQTFVEARGVKAIDGFFAIHPKRFGCPPTEAKDLEIIVCPFPSWLTRLQGKELEVYNGIQQVEVICPDVLGRDIWPFSTPELLVMGLRPPFATNNPLTPISNEELRKKYQQLYIAGEQSVLLWHKQFQNKQIQHQ